MWGQKGVRRHLEVIVAERDTLRIADEVVAMLGYAPRVTSRVVGDLVVLEGEQPSEDEVARIVEIQKRHPQVVSLVARAGFERMVRMEVKMLEIGRNALDRLGVQWQSGRGTPFAIDGPSFGLIGDFKRSRAFQPGGAAEVDGIAVRPRISPFATAATLATSLTSMIDLLVQNGDAAILAEPAIPVGASRLLDLLAVPEEARDFAALGTRLTPGTVLPTPVGIFPRYVEPEAAA